MKGRFNSMKFQKMDERIKQAIEVAIQYGGTDGSHHKAWVIDQMVRILAGERYNDVVASACDGENGQNTYIWDCGIAP